jgi:hypothetical protein
MEAEVLLTIAELSVAFAGFSGIVATFGRRDPRHWSVPDRYRFRALIETSLAAALLALLPSGLAIAPLEPARVWQISSLVVATYTVVSYLASYRRYRSMLSQATSDASRPLMAGIVVCDVGIVALSLYNVLGAKTAWPLVLSLMLLVAQAAFFFARMLFKTFTERAV